MSTLLQRNFTTEYIAILWRTTQLLLFTSCVTCHVGVVDIKQMCLCAIVCLRVYACVHVRVRACAYVCVQMCVEGLVRVGRRV